MISKIEQLVTVTLQLNEDEAKWLKGIVQNPLHNGEETKTDTHMRQELWLALEAIKL